MSGSPLLHAPAPSPSRPAVTPIPGTHRAENEDAFVVTTDERLFVVADGMGGRNAGDVAAHLAVDNCSSSSAPSAPTRASPGRSPSTRARPWAPTSCASASRWRTRGSEKPRRRIRRCFAWARPPAALAVGETQLVVAHVGDVRVYRCATRRDARLTRDHSLIEEMRAARPEMTEEEIAAMAPRATW